MPDAVLVVDMLRGFLEEGYNLYCGEGARKIIPEVQAILDRETARGSSIFYVCDTPRAGRSGVQYVSGPLREGHRRVRGHT